MTGANAEAGTISLTSVLLQLQAIHTAPQAAGWPTLFPKMLLQCLQCLVTAYAWPLLMLCYMGLTKVWLLLEYLAHRLVYAIAVHICRCFVRAYKADTVR